MEKQGESIIFKEFDEYYEATNGLVRTNHPDFNIYKLSEIGNQVVSKIGLFKMSYFHLAIHRKLNTDIQIFGSRLISEEYAQVVFKPGQIIEWQRSEQWEGYVIDVKEDFLNSPFSSLFMKIMLLIYLLVLLINFQKNQLLC
jgi:hypothetical protein